MKKSLLFFGLLLSLGMNAQDVTKFTPGSFSEGVTYYLPKTQINIEVIGENSIYTPGKLCQYANRYLGINNISDKPQSKWDVKSVRINPIGIPDSDNAFSIKLKDKSIASLVELTDNGIIKSINSTNSLKDSFISSTITQAEQQLNPREFMTEDMLNATSTAKLAEIVAKEIYNIRDSRNSLTRGQADYMPKDGSALKLMLDNLDKQERALTEMFIGTHTTQEQLFNYSIIPNKENIKRVLFRISDKLGIISPENLAGEPVYITITDLKVNSALDEKAEKEKAKEKKKEEGIIYNIPGKATLIVSSPKNNYLTTQLPITQFGSTEVLSNDLFKKKINTRIIFNQNTGAIVKIDKDE